MVIKRIPILLVMMVCMIFTGCSSEERFEATYYDMFDTVTTVSGYAKSEEEFRVESEYIYTTLKNYHRQFDIYNSYEGINNLYTLNETAHIAPVEVGAEIIELLTLSKEYYTITEGAFNPAMGAVLSIWHDYRNNITPATLPPTELLTEARKHINFDDVIIDIESNTVFFADEELSLDVGGIAKGFATWKVAENLPEGYLLSVGGNAVATGAKPNGSNWILGLTNPFDGSDNFLHKVNITSETVVTSGDYQRYYTVDSKNYHHIIDPKTLMPAEYFHAVTVISDNSAIADILSTSLFTIPLEEGKNLVDTLDNTAVMWVTVEDEVVFSDKFEEYLA